MKTWTKYVFAVPVAFAVGMAAGRLAKSAGADEPPPAKSAETEVSAPVPVCDAGTAVEPSAEPVRDDGGRAAAPQVAPESERAAASAAEPDRTALEALRREVDRLEAEIAVFSSADGRKAREDRRLIEDYAKNGIVSVGDWKAQREKGFTRTMESIRQRKRSLDEADAAHGGILDWLDTAALAGDDRDVHERFTAHLADFRDGLARFEGATDDEGFVELFRVMQSFMDAGVRAGTLKDREKIALMALAAEKRARAMGFSEADAAVVADAMRAIAEATSVTVH